LNFFFEKLFATDGERKSVEFAAFESWLKKNYKIFKEVMTMKKRRLLLDVFTRR